MPDHPFTNPTLAAMGGQMVQMWQSAVETWWSSLLGDTGRLGQLAKRLAEVGYGGAAGGATGAAEAEDLGRLLDALELMDKRIEGLEEQLREQAESLAAVVGYLERLSTGEGEQEQGVK